MSTMNAIASETCQPALEVGRGACRNIEEAEQVREESPTRREARRQALDGTRQQEAITPMKRAKGAYSQVKFSKTSESRCAA